MTDVVRHQSNGALSERMRFAEALAGADLLPRAFQQRPANVLLAMELGDALGIAPIVAMNEINVIGGSPSLSASLMAALARKAGHKVRITGGADSATCTIVRADDPTYEHTATWDVAKAKAAGLWAKGHWAKDAATMLKWRAVSECVRFACSEVLGGLKYSREEMADISDEPVAAQVESTQATPRGVAGLKQALRREEPASTADEPVDAEVVGEVVGEPAPDRITDAQRAAIFAAFRDAGWTSDARSEEGRAKRLEYMAQVLDGEVVESTNDLTQAQASRVLNALRQDVQDAAQDGDA